MGQVLGFVLGALLVGALWGWRAWRKGTNWAEVQAWIDSCVAAAEQTLQTAEGRAKLDYVIAQVGARFPNLATEQNRAIVRTMIEAAVFQLKLFRVDSDKAVTTPAAPAAPTR